MNMGVDKTRALFDLKYIRHRHRRARFAPIIPMVSEGRPVEVGYNTSMSGLMHLSFEESCSVSAAATSGFIKDSQLALVPCSVVARPLPRIIMPKKRVSKGL